MGATALSLPNYVEENEVLLRQQFLGWVYDLGTTLVGKKNIIERLNIFIKYYLY